MYDVCIKKNEYDGEIRGSTAMELQHFGNEVYSIIGSDVSKIQLMRKHVL